MFLMNVDTLLTVFVGPVVSVHVTVIIFNSSLMRNANENSLPIGRVDRGHKVWSITFFLCNEISAVNPFIELELDRLKGQMCQQV